MRRGDDLERAKAVAVKYLSYRDRSRHEVREYLSKKAFSPAVVRQTLDFLKGLGYVDDGRFAQNWGQSRVHGGRIGRLRLEREFLAKGLAPKLVEETLRDLYADVDESRLARVCAQKKLAGMKGLDTNKQRRRMAQFLERKGFSADMIYNILEQLVPSQPDREFPPE